MCDQSSCFVRQLDAGQNLQTHASESAVPHSPPATVATPPPPDSQDQLAYLDAAGHQQQRPQVKLPRPKAIVRLPVISAPKTTASILERETCIIQPASSTWQDRIRKLLGTRRLITHAPQYKHDSDELLVVTKVPWNDASQLLLPPIATTMLNPTSKMADGPRDAQDSKGGTTITTEEAFDRRISTWLSTSIADLIPASGLEAKSLQGKHEREQTGIHNRAQDERAPFGFVQRSPGSKKALVSIPTDFSESPRVRLSSDKMLNTRLAPAPEAPKAVRPEAVLMSEDEESAEGPSDLRDLERLQSNFHMRLSFVGHETCHEIAVEAEGKYTEDGTARWAEFEKGEPAERSGGAEGPLTAFGGGNDDKKSNEGRCAVEFDIREDAKWSEDDISMMQSNNNGNLDRFQNKAKGAMAKCEDAISQSKDKSVEKLVTIENNKDIETRPHNTDIGEIFAKLIGMKDVDSGYFDIQDGLLSNRMKSNSVL